jgi:CRP-like cAMP-binding protein
MINAMASSGIFDGVGPEELEKLKRTLKLCPRYLSAGEILVDEGEKTDVFWLLFSGRLQGARCYRNGSIDLVQVYTAGDTVCLDVVCTRTRKSLLQISSVKPSEVIAIDYALLTGSAARGAVRGIIVGNIIRLLADESMRKQYKIDVLYKKSLRTRISTFLLHLAEKVGGNSFDIGMDRERLAQYLGVNRSALSHELSLMRQEGLIDFSKSSFELTDSFNAVSDIPKDEGED